MVSTQQKVPNFENNFLLYPSISDGSNYGINGNMSLNRQGELTSPQHRYDLSMGSDKSSSLSHSEGGVYDVVQAESSRANNQQSENNGNIPNSELYPSNGHSTLDSRDGSESSKRKVTPIKRNENTNVIFSCRRAFHSGQNQKVVNVKTYVLCKL